LDVRPYPAVRAAKLKLGLQSILYKLKLGIQSIRAGWLYLMAVTLSVETINAIKPL
jgi:hypothetical protein